MEWTNSVEESLIELWEERQCLYNITDPSYSNRDKRSKAMNELADALKTTGLKVTYDLDKPEGSRVADILVRCAECDVPQYEPLDAVKVYAVVTSDYLINGGDGFSVLRDNIVERENVGALDAAAVTDYIRSRSPIIYGLEGRISYVIPQEKKEDETCISGATSIRLWLSLINIFIIVISLAHL